VIGNLMKESPARRGSPSRFVVYVVLMPALLLLFSAYALGVRPNISESLPIGLYVPSATGPLASICLAGSVGSFVDVRGYRSWGVTCPHMREAVLKAIAAYPGDLVTVTEMGVSINGKLWPHSRPLDADSKGRPLPALRKTLRVRSGMVWVMGLHPKSFDSRYFGEIPDTWIADRMRTLWIWR
jgi:conjugative transfer signal peptidase TraF